MVIYDLHCEFSHEFEGWFKDSDDLVTQQTSGILTCPYCGSGNIAKKLTAAKLSRKSNRSAPNTTNQEIVTSATSADKFTKLQHMLSNVHDYIDANFQDVGNQFANRAISMHRGEQEQASIKGTASSDQLQELVEEGVPVLPLPAKPIDKKKLN